VKAVHRCPPYIVIAGRSRRTHLPADWQMPAAWHLEQAMPSVFPANRLESAWHPRCTNTYRVIVMADDQWSTDMQRMVVVIFDTDDQAYNASRALKELADDNFIAVNADGVVTKNPDGTTQVVETHGLAPEGTMGGSVVGGLIGLIGGPAGLAIGATAGFLLGAGTDVSRARVGRDFVRDVQNELEPGKSALVAQIDEESTEFVDARMDALGGVVFRRALSDVTDNEFERDVSGIQADLAQTRDEHARSRAERKQRLQARIDSLNEKLRDAFDHAS
jgi:uncharacterized membrane protein